MLERYETTVWEIYPAALHCTFCLWVNVGRIVDRTVGKVVGRSNGGSHQPAFYNAMFLGSPAPCFTGVLDT